MVSRKFINSQVGISQTGVCNLHTTSISEKLISSDFDGINVEYIANKYVCRFMLIYGNLIRVSLRLSLTCFQLMEFIKFRILTHLSGSSSVTPALHNASGWIRCFLASDRGAIPQHGLARPFRGSRTSDRIS